MPRVIYHDTEGRRLEVEVARGFTVMEGALDNDVKGIVAECGGACACATCHAYIGEEWLEFLPPVSAMEDAMLDSAVERRSNSRLTCQIEMDDRLDGLELQIADNGA